MSLSKDIIISEKYLKQILDQYARTCAGTVLARIETITDNAESLKKCVKDTIYENFRHLDNAIISFSAGMEHFKIKFINTEKPEQK